MLFRSSFSRSTWQSVWDQLDRHVSAKKVKGYYESVFAEMAAEGSLTFAPVFFDADRWYEIDTLEDLRAAEQLFPRRSPVQIATQRLRHSVQEITPIAAQGALITGSNSQRGDSPRFIPVPAFD